MRSVSVGVIGAGGRAKSHCEALSLLDDCTVAAVCDLSESRAESLADQYGVEKTFTDYERMLAEVDFDAVYVVTPPSYMDPIVTNVLSAGTHLFVEKPPGIHAGQTKAWAQLAEENDCITTVGFQRRFHPLLREARRRIEAKSSVLYSSASFHKHNPETPVEQLTEWMESADDDVGSLQVANWLLLDIIHAIDLLVSVGGDVSDVSSLSGQLYADEANFDPTHMNLYTATLEFQNGGVGKLTSNRVAGGRKFSFELHGEGISAYGEIPGTPGVDTLVMQREGQAYAEADRITTDDLDVDGEEIYQDGTHQINEHFLDCIRGAETPEVRLRDTVESMEIVSEVLHGDRFPSVFTG